ncbi:MAG: hypothetical protein JXQ99_15090 [Hyphomicrobiaceae bacterium]
MASQTACEMLGEGPDTCRIAQILVRQNPDVGLEFLDWWFEPGKAWIPIADEARQHGQAQAAGGKLSERDERVASGDDLAVLFDALHPGAGW